MYFSEVEFVALALCWAFSSYSFRACFSRSFRPSCSR